MIKFNLTEKDIYNLHPIPYTIIQLQLWYPELKDFMGIVLTAVLFLLISPTTDIIVSRKRLIKLIFETKWFWYSVAIHIAHALYAGTKLT